MACHYLTRTQSIVYLHPGTKLRPLKTTGVQVTAGSPGHNGALQSPALTLLQNQLLCRKQRRGEMENYKGSATQWPSRASNDWLSTPATPCPKCTMASRTPKLHGKTKKQRSHMKSVPHPYSIPNVQLAKCCTSHPSDPHLYTSCNTPSPRKPSAMGSVTRLPFKKMLYIMPCFAPSRVEACAKHDKHSFLLVAKLLKC